MMEPLGWVQIGLMNGHHYIRMVYDRNPYPPDANIVRNLALVPVYATPQPLTPAQAAAEQLLEALKTMLDEDGFGHLSDAAVASASENGESYWTAVKNARAAIRAAEGDKP